MSYISPEISKAIAEFLISYGPIGLVTLFLLEDRRRLTNKLNDVEKKLDEGYKARIEMVKEVYGVVKDNESVISRLEGSVNTLLSYKPKVR